MATEIERKFLLKDDSWNTGISGVFYKQGYLISSKERTVRVRIAGDKGFITIKGPSPEGAIGRPEYEYEIPLADADEIFETLCLPEKIEKIRYHVPYGDRIWEIDVFQGANQGLVTAEIEFEHENEMIEIPPWAGEEVTHDRRYANGRLIQEPFSTW